MRNRSPSRLLAWVGGAVTLLGVVFLLVLAVQRGWLGPATRVIGGAGLGGALLATGMWTHRRPGGAVGGYALAATGLAALYLDVVAATALYGYLPVFDGLIAGFLITAAGLMLADRWRAQPLAVGAVLGCALCTPLISPTADATLVGFLVLLQVVATPVQLRHGWNHLTWAAAVPALLASVFAVVATMWAPDERLALVGAASTAALLGIVLATVTATVRPFDHTSTAVLIASPVPALLAAGLLERRAAGSLVCCVAVLLLTIWAAPLLSSWARRLPDVFTGAAGGLAGVAAVQATMTFLQSTVWPTALLCEALLLTFGALWLRRIGVLIGSTSYTVVGVGLALFRDIPPLRLLVADHPSDTGDVLIGMLTALLAVAIPVSAARLGVLSGPPQAKTLWTLSGLLLLYGTASATMALVLLIQPERSGFLTGHVLITLSWVVAAIVLLLRGIARSHLRIAGMVLLPVALSKLFLFDLATLDGFARVVAFLCVGLVLLTAGVRYARLVTAEQ